MLYTSGMSAEKAAEKYCLDNGLEYSNYDLQKFGIDFIYSKDGRPTSVDVKNTFDLYIGNIELDSLYSPHFKLRHPWRYTNQADEIWIFDSKKKGWAYQGSLNEYLDKFFSSNAMKTKFKNYLNKIANETVKLNAEMYMNNLKKDLKPFVRDNVYISYDTQGSQTYIRMITYEDNNYKKSQW